MSTFNELRFVDSAAEKAAVGALILDSDAKGTKRVYNHALNIQASRTWFSDPLCAIVYGVVIDRIQQNKPIDVVLISDEVVRQNPTITENVTSSILQWEDICVSMHHGAHYLNVVKEKWQQRMIAVKLNEGYAKLEAQEPIVDTVSAIRHSLAMVPNCQFNAETNESIYQTCRADYLVAKTRGFSGCPSRWFRFQERFGGWPKGKLIIVGGRPAQGKSTFMNNESAYLAVFKGIPTAIASMEMSKREWLENAICAEAGLDASKFRNGSFTERELACFDAMAQKFMKAPLYIDDRTHTIGSLCTFIRDMATDKGCQMIVFDYLQLIKSEKEGKKGTRNEEVGNWSNQLANTAKELPNTAVIGISQLNRGGTGFDKGKQIIMKPELQNLRDSGSIEQDAYMIVFIYQDPNVGGEIMRDDAPTIVEVAKRRGGKTGILEMRFEKTKQRLVEAGTMTTDSIDHPVDHEELSQVGAEAAPF